MTRRTAKDFHPDLRELSDFHAHGRITRREFLDCAAALAGLGLTAAGLLAAMAPNHALAQQVAPDRLPSVGGHPGEDDKGRELQATVDSTKLRHDFFAAVEFLMAHDLTTGKVGITGFCHGGGVANAGAVAYPELACAVEGGWRAPRGAYLSRP